MLASLQQMKIMRVYLLLIAVVLGSALVAQSGKITGTISELQNSQLKLLPNTTVAVADTDIVEAADEKGIYTIKLPAGTYKLYFSHVGYGTDSVVNIELKAGETKVINSVLVSSAKTTNVINISAKRKANTEAAVNNQLKKDDKVGSGVSAEQISKQPAARTATDVVKTIPGVTIIDNRFVMVRGLSERYNSVMLNGVFTPSTEPDRRAFSFDMLPSGALDRLFIYKSGAPELSGEFAGAAIEVFTKDPDTNSITFGYTAGYRAGTTGSEFFQGSTSPSDIFGYDNGTRDLPSNFPSHLSKVANPTVLSSLGQSLPNTWTATESKAPIDTRLNFTITRKFGKKVGNITSVNYSNVSEFFSTSNLNYNTYDPIAKKSDTIYHFTDKNYLNSVRLGVLHNWNFKLSETSTIEFKNTFNQLGSNQAILRTGQSFEEGFDVKNYAYRYLERSIYTGQLRGIHQFKNKLTKLNWTTAYSLANSAEPDYRRIRTIRDIAAQGTNTPYELVIAPSASVLDAGRFYSTLSENIIAAAANFEHKFSSFSKTEIAKKEGVKLKLGFYYEQKERDFAARWMSYKKSKTSQFDATLLSKPLDEIFAAQNINATAGFKLDEGTNSSDAYTASNQLMAFYGGTRFRLGSKLDLSGGARAEYNRMKLNSFINANAVEVDNPVLSILPSVNVAYRFSEDTSLIRAAYSRTLNRPEFRELAPFGYYDFTRNTVLYGNDSLKNASIDNVDLRYELYPTKEELISFGVFYKRFTNPIEMFFVPGSGSGGTRNFTFKNADLATSYGAELEVKKSLKKFTKSKLINDMSAVVNASYIISKVELGANAVGQNPNRPMMGQSPYIINAGIYYDNDKQKMQVSILYNVIGKRIFAVGTFGTPDIYEMPRNLLDISIAKSIGKHTNIKLSVQDIFNQPVLLKQDSNLDNKVNENDEEIQSFRRGQYINLGVTFKF